MDSERTDKMAENDCRDDKGGCGASVEARHKDCYTDSNIIFPNPLRQPIMLDDIHLDTNKAENKRLNDCWILWDGRL